ncbi:HIT-like protein [Tothia fuscella]|uniref:HIT-like protein n=1 Tax=Tothia fuscella TaxID=1048955 RepID=A0A9P4TTS9_9PEZI|nr:HIT-like protein [Tothia fuscella]
MSLTLSQTLPRLVEGKLQSAKECKALTFAGSFSSIIHTKTGIPFQLRYCPSLAKKPTPDKDESASKKPKINPFENPDPALFIADIPSSDSPTHFLILNKFPIIPYHFILATKQNKQQTQVLEEDDLTATYAVLREWEKDGTDKRLFGFFNSGPHSGASQAHRHLQFLPLESMKQDPPTGWDLLIDQISKHNGQSVKVPFAYSSERIPKEPTASQLKSIYNRLYEQASRKVEQYFRSNADSANSPKAEPGAPPFSYNLAFTTTAMIICPRRAEGDVLLKENGTKVGFVALNGTLLAGTLMVKEEAAWNWLKDSKGRVDQVLEAIGFPPHDASDSEVKM